MPADEQEFHAKAILDRVGSDTVIYTLTTYGKGQTDYVRAFVVYNGEIDELTYHVSQLTSYRANPDRGGLALGGGGYSKGLDVFLAVCKLADVSSDQGKWRTI